jgi:hypothetical protein
MKENAMRSCFVLVALAVATAARASCPDYAPLKNAYFGDMHNHTSYSLDAYNFGTRTDPAMSYAFARGAAVDIGLGYDPNNGEVPGPLGVTISFSGGRLDFGAVTDHSEWLATDYGCTVDTASPFYDASYCRRLRNLRNPPANQRPCLGFMDHAGTGCQAEQTTAWGAENAATEAANEPCTFTAFHAYEWTFSLSPQGDPQQDKQTLHKNVFFRNANVPAVPLDALDYPTSPTLWAALAAQCNATNGCNALTIPHNMNQSNGLAFAIDGYNAPDLNRMMKFQRLAEIHQHKANSECLTDTADTGEVTACDFEVNPTFAFPGDPPGYARPGLESGLTRFAARGYDPLHFGFVGATDNHDGTMGNVGEATWPGFIGSMDNTPLRRLTRNPFKVNPGGITGIWAEENTREALWAALVRRETFATSGPKIRVRFYEYTGGNPCADPGFPADVVSRGGVPMGGTMAYAGSAPSFVVYALQDETPLAAVDVVKASVAGGTAVESVHTIPFAAPPYCVTWTDPAFDPTAPSFYYARVREQSTWRWSHYDCERVKASDPNDWQTLVPGCASSDPATGLDVTIQERAWTSPIWYLPGQPITVPATALALHDGSKSHKPGRRRFLFKSSTGSAAPEHRIAVPAAGSPGDPTAAGASGGGGSVTVYNPASGETFTADLPAKNWKVGRKGTRYSFRDPAGPIQSVLLSADRLVVRGGRNRFRYTLNEPSQGSVSVRLRLGTAPPWCADVPAKTSGKPPTTRRNDHVDRFVGQPNAAPPDDCPISGSPSGAFLNF